MKKFINLSLCACVCAVAFGIGRLSAGSESREPENVANASEMQQENGLLCNYVLDVVDESDFWDLCDSARFQGETDTPEWYLSVIIEYQRMYH